MSSSVWTIRRHVRVAERRRPSELGAAPFVAGDSIEADPGRFLPTRTRPAQLTMSVIDAENTTLEIAHVVLASVTTDQHRGATLTLERIASARRAPFPGISTARSALTPRCRRSPINAASRRCSSSNASFPPSSRQSPRESPGSPPRAPQNTIDLHALVVPDIWRRPEVCTVQRPATHHAEPAAAHSSRKRSR
jgi:hypothetical protein